MVNLNFGAVSIKHLSCGYLSTIDKNNNNRKQLINKISEKQDIYVLDRPILFGLNDETIIQTKEGTIKDRKDFDELVCKSARAWGLGARIIKDLTEKQIKNIEEKISIKKEKQKIQDEKERIQDEKQAIQDEKQTQAALESLNELQRFKIK